MGAAEGDRYVEIENIEATDGDDLIVGDDGFNYLNGLNGSDIIKGGGDTDLIVSGGGIDFLEGGAGNDLFFITPDRLGRVYIMDFTPGVDKIDLSKFSGTEPLMLTRHHEDTVITKGGWYHVILKNILPTQLLTRDLLLWPEVESILIGDGVVGRTSQGDAFGNTILTYIGDDTVTGGDGTTQSSP